MFNFRSVFSFDADLASSKKQTYLTSKLDNFVEDENGIATVWSMFWLILCFSISGLAIDVTNAWKVHAILQSTADVSALAGAYELSTADNEDIEVLVEAEANEYASFNMLPTRYGDVLSDQDIIVGWWDKNDRTFTALVEPIDPDDARGPVNAVRTVTRQTGANGTSAVGTFFLRFVGFDRFSVVTAATAKMFTAKCDYDGIMSDGFVAMSTDQHFIDEYCIHGEEGINISQANVFDIGTVASMANLNNCGPSEGHCLDSANEGIEAALQEKSLRYSKAAHIDDYLESMPSYDDGDVNTSVTRYITSILLEGQKTVPLVGSFVRNDIPVSNRNQFDMSLLIPGRINVIQCPRDGYNVNLSFDSNNAAESILVSNMIVVGDGCDFSFDSNTKYEDSIIATNATGNQTFSGSAGVVLGRNDGCTQGGEVTLITKGSVGFAAKLSAFDLEIIAEQEVHLAAHANETSIHVGTSISSGGDVKITTGHTFAGCAGQTESVWDIVKSWALVL